MKCFVLGAGEGTRLWPFSSVIPKVLMPVGAKPCVRWIVEAVLQQGFEPVLCILSKDATLFHHEFRDLKQVFIHGDPEPRGTGGQIPLDLLGEEPFAVWYGDNLIRVDLQGVVSGHRRTGAMATLVVTKKVRLDYGRITLDTQGMQVKGFEEKPFIGEYLWTGVAVFEPGIREHLRAGVDLASGVFPILLRQGKAVYADPTDAEWFDIGTLGAYLRVNEMAARGGLEL